MSRSNHEGRRTPARLRAAAALVALAALLPALALAQAGAGAERTAPPLPERVRALDESLKEEHDDLVQQASAGARDGGRFAAALKAQQAAWLQYRDATCALDGMLSGAGASVATTRTLQCKAQWAEAQRMRLWSALDCIGQVPPAERAAEHERCLQTLVQAPVQAPASPPRP